MTNQDLFNRLVSNMAVYNRLQYAIKLEMSKDAPRYVSGLYQASGELVAENKELLREYSQADMVIFKCDPGCDEHPFWVTTEQLKDAEGWVECEYCGKACQRLLSNGEWQSEKERYQENLKQL